ncbi:hypothetical protein PtA15_15A255 [Puccinia triticina]|uniref:GH18 domain-containing protein n=1 Tax=Puccinia triticina TaxID=208348 RepID=A0ABY7D417_9BASI|nr:uncharacterized protein PtA15_15A255 [Puccinia triticina]WAQ91863.1 hypothetical protein PtA15_15A255 [Puccinia triticina]WAR62660.1 hypothetical protein PtB15_15B247 [Puccinia triticina]
MRIVRLISSGLMIYGSGYLGGSQANQSSSTGTPDRRAPKSQHNTLKSFVTRSVDLTQEYPHRTCMKPADVMEDVNGHQRRDLPAFSYPFTFSDVVSPRARLGQLIVNPLPYTEPPPKVHPLSPQKPTNRLSELLPQSLPQSLPQLLPQSHIQYHKFDIIYFAFGIPNENYGVDFTQSDSKQTLDKLVGYAHGNGTRVVLSVGGWGGSKFFSVAVKSDSTRQVFANNLYQLVLTHNLDGIDIDWEYPGQAQIQDNIVSSEDSAALLSFFQLLRAKLGPHKIISAAVTDYTFLNAQGGRMTNVEEFGKVLDYILIMNYDVWGATANPGPNAPFSNGCEDSSQPGANMVSSIKTWTSAGFPRQKILMGLAAYGYINHASVTTLVHRKRSEIPQMSRRFDHYLAQVNRQLNKRQNPCWDPSGVTCLTPNVSAAPPSLTAPITNLPPQSVVQTPSTNTIPPSVVQVPAVSVNQTLPPSVDQTFLSGTNQTSSMSINLTQTLDPNATTTLHATTTTNPVLMDVGSNDPAGLLRTASSGIGSGNLDGHSGSQIQFTDLFKWGIVQQNLADSEGRLNGINDYQVAWDRCSSTPYAFSKSRNIVITYDDPISIGIKASYALAAGIGGVGFWDMTGDHNSMLIDSARKNLARIG